jgi:hypothetical protein
MEPSPAPLTRRWQTVWRHLAVLVIPAAYLAATAWATREVRPLWMGGSTDPTYPYVLNALLVAEGRAPAQATHPGTPLQALGAVVLRAAHGISGSALDLRRHVLTDPEYFTDAFRGTLVALITLAAIAQGLAALHLTGSVLCAMAAQAAPMASVWTVRSSILVMAETLVLALGFAVSAAVLRSLRRGPDAAPRAAATIGALVGISVATKVMYASLALLPLVWLRTARLRVVALGALAAAFAVGVAPLGRKLPAVAVWLLAVFFHTGAWGSGPPGFIVPGSYPRALAAILAGDPLIHGSIALLLVAAALCRSPDPPVQAARRCAWAVIAAAVLSVLLGAKQSPIATYYHMPAVSLAGLALVLAYRLFSCSAPASRWPRAVAALWLAAAVGYQAWWLERFLERRQPVRPGAAEAARAAAAAGGDRVLQGYSVSSVASALTFANEWAGRSFSAELRALYPRAYSYDWAGLHLFGRPLTVGELDGLLVDGDSFVLLDAVWWPYDSWDWFRGAVVERVAGYQRDQVFRARLVPVDETTAATSPPFAGLLILTGSSDRPSLERVHPPYIEPLGPVTRLAALGTGSPARLVGECQYAGSGGQVLRVQVDGREAGREEIAGSSEWHRFSVALPPRGGLVGVDILYDRLFENPAAARPRFPGYADVEHDTRWPAVRYRRLQIWRSAGPGGA